MNKPLPNELIQPIMEIVGYALTFVAGVIAKWLQGKNRKQSKSLKNEE